MCIGHKKNINIIKIKKPFKNRLLLYIIREINKIGLLGPVTRIGNTDKGNSGNRLSEQEEINDDV
ncbi:hypothetical protein CLOSTHATH_01860 [Hungatella hathewayi DSM 13479]|uniref:Uncharacterized protein n=1 Tax=Hungatella hathewayi DSM 13479 TaxID=566550 RepID=D3AE31_9FIRM|nr:hypothetical protein CLOSTHATH_01860 [Hungatella hathewayi DSM 13479]